MNEKNANPSTSFISHLSELRSRLLRSSAFFLIAFVISYIFAENIYSYLVKPYSNAVIENELNRRLIFTALHEAFLTYLKVAFFTAVFITSPIFLTEISSLFANI